MNLNNLETLSRRNLNKFRTNLDAIIEKFSQPFDERYHDVIDLTTLTICSDKGQLRSKSYKSKKFGKVKLALEHCLDLTTYIEDSALGTSDLSNTLIEPNTPESKLHDSLTEPVCHSVNHNTSFQNDILCELGNEEPEPSDAETLSESDSDSWESDDEVRDKGGSSSISKETSEDAESTPEETLDKSLNSEANLPVSSEDVASTGVIDLRVEELSRSSELYSSAVILRHENEEFLKDSASSECGPQFKVIAELNTSPEILKLHSGLGLPKSGFVFENYFHLMRDHTKSKYCKAQGEVLFSRSVAINDKIAGQDNDVQVRNDSNGVGSREREPSLGDLCKEMRQNQDVQKDVSSDGSGNNHSTILGFNKALSIEELGDLNHVGAICNVQNHASCELQPGLSTSKARKVFNSTFTVMPSVDTDNNGLSQEEQHILQNDFSIDDNLIRRRCHRSDLQKSGCLAMNLSDNSKSSSSVSISETTHEICKKSCINRPGSNQMVKSAIVSSKGGPFSLTTISSQPIDQSLMKLPNRSEDLSASDKPAVTLCDCVPCFSTASAVNLLPGLKTTYSKKSSCLADPPQLPSMKRLQEMFEQMKSVVPKVIHEKVLPLVVSELPTCAANRTETDFNHLVMCNETSSVAENIDQDVCMVSDTCGPEVQMVEKPFSFMGNHKLPSSGLTNSSTEQSHLSYASRPDSCKIAHRNCNNVNSAYTKLCRRTVEMSAFPKTPTQQIGNAFLNSWQQKACADSRTASFSPSECFSKMKLSSPEVLETCVENQQHSLPKSRRDIFQQAGKVAEINNNSSSVQPVSISCDQRRGTLIPNVEELCTRVNCVSAMKEIEQQTNSASHADQIVGVKSYWLNESEVRHGDRGSVVSLQSLNHVEPTIKMKTEFPSAEDLSDIASDTDEENCCLLLLSDVEEAKDAGSENNVIIAIKQEVVHGDTEPEDARAVTLAGATSTPTKDESGFIFDTSFLSCISDSSEIERMKELAMQVIFEEDLEETLIEKTKIKSSLTAGPTEKTDLPSVTCARMTEGDDKSLEQFDFLSPSDELHGIDSLAAFRHVVQGNKIMAKTGLETASREIIRFNVNGTVHNMAMRKTDEKVPKPDKISCARDEGKMYNHQKEKLLRSVSIPITKILEINDNDMIKTNRQVLKTNLEMRNISDNGKTVGEKKDRTKEVCVGQRHPNSLNMPLSSNDAIQVRKRFRKVCTLDQTVAPASTCVSSEAQLWVKLSDNPSSVSVNSGVKATCPIGSQSALVGAVKCLPLVPVSSQPTKIESGIVCQPSAPSSISAPAKLSYSHYLEKMHHKAENEKETFAHHQKTASSQSDVSSVVSVPIHKSRFDWYLPNARKNEVESTASHKTPKRSSDNCHIELDRSTKRYRSSLWESSDNDKKIVLNETQPDEKWNETRIGLHMSPAIKTRKCKRASCFSSVAK